MTSQEPAILIRSREELLYLLAEAAEIEHNLMCCYLFAAFSMKGDGELSAEDAAEVGIWKRAMIHVAVEEMTHLALVSNLLSAIGGVPHFSRPNFPVAPGYHPSGVVVQLRRFDAATLDHFIFLERPEGIALPDGEGFAAGSDPNYTRSTPSRKFMPSAQDYLTVGHLYRSIRAGLEQLSAKLGEAALFSGNSALQVGPELISLPGICRITDLASALSALDTIVVQGEGSPADTARSHYRRFVAIREAFDAKRTADPSFDPSRPVAPNPVMRRPPSPEGKTFVEAQPAADVMELANAIYGAMLRALVQGFTETEPERKKKLLDAAIDGMFVISPVAESLTTLPASPTAPGLTAGMSFATLRDVAPLASSAAVERVFAERLYELADGAAHVLSGDLAKTVCDALRGIATKLAGDTAQSGEANTVETVAGKDIVISFDTQRCIHARFCVLQQPRVFKANVVGAWIIPDDATSTEGLVATAQSCPSGAITYQRLDGKPEEAAPPVNLVQIRENGPLALRAELTLDGKPIGFRATLCRCGESKNKPSCDNSHKHAEFSATGEPKPADLPDLTARNGPLDIRPQKNGPLVLSGNMEIISGTGRAFCKATSATLCRCGHSAAKPFCDGSHARVGFKS
jgi:CDGSH-type Zn-finger protein/uncharacterized Fe-S cluster protein YjdI